MKKMNSIISYRILIVFSFLILVSCDLGEISKIEDVNVKTETRIVIPLAYGTFDIQNFIDYLGADNSILPIDEEGSLSFEPIITEVQLSDSFAFQGSMLDILSHLELRIETKNKLPLGVSIELLFKDSVLSTNFGPSVQCNLLKPGIMDQNGKVTEVTHHVETIILTNELIEEYRKASNILANIRFFLPDTRSKLIYINQDDFLSVNIGVVVQAKTIEGFY